MRHEVESTHRVAEVLRDSAAVKRVNYVGFEDNPWHENAKKYVKLGAGAVLNVNCKARLKQR